MEPFQSGFLQQGYGGEDSSPAVFGAGGAAMHLMGQWDPSVQESSSGTSLGDDLGWFPFPAVEGGKGSINEVYGGGNGHAVGANAPDYAVDFLVFLATEAYDRILEQEPSIIPVTLDAEIPASEVNRILIKETVANASAFQLYFDQDLPPRGRRPGERECRGDHRRVAYPGGGRAADARHLPGRAGLRGRSE